MEASPTLRIALLGGDGVGPEVAEAAIRVLEAVAGGGTQVVVERWPIGWAAVRETGEPLPKETLDACLAADAVLLGAVGDPAAEGSPDAQRPERGLLGLRAGLECWANLRPIRVPDALVGASALRPERVAGTDMLIVRELGGGLYYGKPRGDDGHRAWNTLRYDDVEVRRIAEMAFDLAAARRGRVTSVDKANVLEVSRLWRRVVQEVADDRAALEHMLVDRAAMELVLNPTRFDVILTGNLFGDILSDEAAALAGSLGVLGSASLGGSTDLYEPVHGSAPDIAGRGVANPIGAMTSVAMMLRHTFGRDADADRIDRAIERALTDGARTVDLARTGDGDALGTEEFTEAVLARLDDAGPSTAPPLSASA